MVPLSLLCDTWCDICCLLAQTGTGRSQVTASDQWPAGRGRAWSQYRLYRPPGPGLPPDPALLGRELPPWIKTLIVGDDGLPFKWMQPLV